MANNQCKECGCVCSKCANNDQEVHLHVEIENLKQRLVERDNHIVTMETNFLNEANKFPNGEIVALRDELITWQDKYKRLHEAHRRVQRVNQGLEDKLLRLVDVSETDKNTLTRDVATLSHKLAEANYTIKKLNLDNERYKNDVSLAIQFLQCKPAHFVSQKFDSLPPEVQAQVSTYMANKRKPEDRKTPPEIKSIKVPIPTFPPTAMVFSVPKSPNATRKDEGDAAAAHPAVDIVSAAIMAKVLEERERERSTLKHCDTCTCSKTLKIIHNTTHHSISTQTGDSNNSLCLKCNDMLESRSTIVKIVKNVEQAYKNKPIHIYIHDYNESSANQNVAKVQPNNFLIDTKTTDSVNVDSDNKLELSNAVAPSEVVNLNLDVSNGNIASSVHNNDDTIFFNVNEKEKGLMHHRLCVNNMSSKNSKVTKKSGAKAFESSDIYKGGRHCSMRLQSHSKNIFLTDMPQNVKPVLYTRHNEKSASQHENDDCSSKNTQLESVTSSADSKSSVSEEVSNQRVAEWIQSSIQIGRTSDYSESLNSQKTDDKGEVDKEKYKVMEDNVKKFLFGDSDFLPVSERLSVEEYGSIGTNVAEAGAPL